MVAISLYKGNLHNVPDVPRRWLMPTPKISLKDFRVLLRRRSRALSRLNSFTASTIGDPISFANPNPVDRCDSEVKPEVSSFEPTEIIIKEEEVLVEKGSDADDSATKTAKGSGPEFEEKINDIAKEEKVLENGNGPVNSNFETSNKTYVSSDNEKRKREVEEKLKVLNTKKHSLVQLLKQVLNAEDELKRRSVPGTRSSTLLQVDTTTDHGSMTRVSTPRTGAEGPTSGEMEAGEAEDLANPNVQFRHLVRTNSTSPSSDSQLRKFSPSLVSLPSRTTSGVAGSPSRFAPAGPQGPSVIIPSVSISGTNYAVSSPSPAASGGTSVFRDCRHPSPWN